MNIHEHQPRKRFGQHFLIDQSVIARIIAVISPQVDEHLVEIGPGFGAITTALLSIVKKMDVVELDRDVIPYLKTICADLGELTIHQADALKFDFAQLATDKTPLRIVGNLPYNISTPLIFHLLEYITLIKDMHFMLQREVVERMAAAPGSSAYGRLSVMVQYHCQVQNLLTVGPSSFKPPPKVDSAVVRLIPRTEKTIVVNNMEIFQQVVLHAFNQRRKMLHNSIRDWISASDLAAINIDPNTRAEQLSVSDFVKISNAVNRAHRPERSEG